MKKCLFVLLVLVSQCSVLFAAQFTLKLDANRKVYGPFSDKVGSKVVIGKSELEVMAGATAGSIKLKSMKSGNIVGPFAIRNGSKVKLGSYEFSVIVVPEKRATSTTPRVVTTSSPEGSPEVLAHLAAVGKLCNITYKELFGGKKGINYNVLCSPASSHTNYRVPELGAEIEAVIKELEAALLLEPKNETVRVLLGIVKLFGLRQPEQTKKEGLKILEDLLKTAKDPKIKYSVGLMLWREGELSPPSGLAIENQTLSIQARYYESRARERKYSVDIVGLPVTYEQIDAKLKKYCLLLYRQHADPKNYPKGQALECKYIFEKLGREARKEVYTAMIAEPNHYLPHIASIFAREEAWVGDMGYLAGWLAMLKDLHSEKKTVWQPLMLLNTLDLHQYDSVSDDRKSAVRKNVSKLRSEENYLGIYDMATKIVQDNISIKLSAATVSERIKSKWHVDFRSAKQGLPGGRVIQVERSRRITK